MGELIKKLLGALGAAPQPQRQPIRVEKDKPQWWEASK